MEWKTILINSNNIETTNGNSTLIKMPNNSEYSGYKFWHPSKLIRSKGKGNWSFSLSYTNEFEFKIFKNGNGKYNKFEKIDQLTISSKDIEYYFEKMNTKISDDLKSSKIFLKVQETTPISDKVEIVNDLKK